MKTTFNDDYSSTDEKASYSDRDFISMSSSSSPSLSGTTFRRRKYSSECGGGTRRKFKDDDVKTTSDDAEKRRIRRERNKLAAARCRQRLIDLTSHLLTETEILQREKSTLELEVSKLEQQRNQLRFVLDVHLPHCNQRVTAVNTNGESKAESEPWSLLPPVVKVENTADSYYDCQSVVTSSRRRPAHLWLTDQYALDDGEFQPITDSLTSSTLHYGDDINTPTCGELLSPTFFLAFK